MNELVKELAKKNEEVLVLSIEADSEELSDIAESFEVEAVPTFVLLRGHTLLQRIAGADGAALTSALQQHGRKAPQPLSKTEKEPAPPPAVPNGDVVSEKTESQEELEERMKNIMKQSNVVLFMKGVPDAPRCGFSRQTVAILREQGVDFTSFDILTDEAVRQGLKRLNDWPTFPQLIVKGEFFGGLDIIKESIQTGEFAEVKETLKG